jgi:hypothetical protein
MWIFLSRLRVVAVEGVDGISSFFLSRHVLVVARRFFVILASSLGEFGSSKKEIA